MSNAPLSVKIPTQWEQAQDALGSAEFAEYGNEIHEYMKAVESTTLPIAGYMKISQSTGQIDWKMRKTLVVWLVQVHKEYNLQPETLQLAVNFLDRYCSVAPVLRSHYQLLGIVCLWIAAKYEENYGRVPNVKNLSFMCCDSYSERQFTLCENQVLRVLDFNLGHPTAESFLKRLLALNPHVFTNPESAALARFISELALPQHHFVGVAPSVIAQAALLLAFQISNAHPGWRVDTEIEYTRSQLLDCILDAPAPILAKYATLNYYSCSLVAQDWCRANLSGLYSSGQLTPPKDTVGAGFHW